MPNPAPPPPPLAAFAVTPVDPVDIKGALRALWYGKFRILAAMLIAVLATGYYGFFVDAPRYTATTTLRFAPVLQDARTVSMAGQLQITDKTRRNTEIQMIQSRHLLKQVIDELALLNDPAFNRHLAPGGPWSVPALRAKARQWITGRSEPAPTEAQVMAKTIDNLSQTLSVRGVRDTDIVEIIVMARDADRAVAIANTLVDTYLADQIRAKQTTAERTLVWLSHQVAHLQDELGQKEGEIARLISVTGAEGARQLDALGARLGRTEQQIRDTERALQEAEATLQATEVSQSTADRAQLAAEVARYAIHSADLQGFHADLSNKLAAHSADLLALQQLRREAAATRVVYETFLSRLQETSLRQGGEAPDSRVLTYAQQAEYAGPYRLLTLGVAALLGFLLASGAVLIRHFGRSGFNTGAELEFETGRSVAAEIPAPPSRRPKALITHLLKQPDSPLATAYRRLRTTLLGDPEPRVMISTACDASVNGTSQTIGLAMAIAKLDRNVLVIDLCPVNRSVAHYFQTKSCNLTQVVDGIVPLQDAITHDHRTQLDLLCHQDAQSNPADIVGRLDFDIFLKSLKAQYDVIVFNTGPVTERTEATVLAQKSDITVLAVGWVRNTSEQVQKALRHLQMREGGETVLTLCEVNIRRQKQIGSRAQSRRAILAGAR